MPERNRKAQTAAGVIMTVYNWNNPKSGDWSSSLNWAPGGVPGEPDFVVMDDGEAVANGATIKSSIILDSASSDRYATLTLNNSVLANSSYIVSTGAGNDAFINANNTALYGIIAAGYGPTIFSVASGTSAVNYGYMGASNPNAPADLIMEISGSFSNNPNSYIVSGQNGAVNLLFGEQQYNGQQVIWNSGVEEANGGGMSFTAMYGGAVGNQGTLLTHNGGHLAIYANLVNLGSAAKVEDVSGGDLILGGSASGSTIHIQDSMLEIQQPSLKFISSPLWLDGQRDVIQIDHATVSKLGVGDVSGQQVLSFVADYGNGTTVTAALPIDPSHPVAIGNFSVGQNGDSSQIIWAHS